MRRRCLRSRSLHPRTRLQTGTERSLWTVVAHNERVNRAWQELMKSAPSNAAKCYDHLRATPMLRRQGRIFPLRGKKYAGAWEYELTGGKRLFYVPDPRIQKVNVYYAGPHLDPAPFPPMMPG